MGGSSSNGNTSSGGLSSLFLGNQPTQTGQQSTVPPIAAPQSQIGQMNFSQLPSSQAPVQTQAPISQSAPRSPLLHGATAPSNFRADQQNPGYGWMNLMTGSEHGQPTYSQYYVSAPNQAPAQAAPVYQPSQASQMAALINAQYGKK